MTRYTYRKVSKISLGIRSEGLFDSVIRYYSNGSSGSICEFENFIRQRCTKCSVWSVLAGAEMVVNGGGSGLTSSADRRTRLSVSSWLYVKISYSSYGCSTLGCYKDVCIQVFKLPWPLWLCLY